MTVPDTKGQLRTKLADMEIGDYIACKYTAESAAAGKFSNLGGTVGTELSSVPSSLVYPDGYFYFIKADKGLLIADRVIQTGITWATLRNAGFIDGVQVVSSVVPKMTSDTTPTGCTITTSSSYGGGYEGYRAFDGVIDTDSHGWGTTGAGDQWIQLEFLSSIIPTQYGFSPRGDTGSIFATNWQFQGWNGLDWVTLDTRTGIGDSDFMLQKLTYWDFKNITPYSKVRWFFPAVSSYVWIEEIVLGEGPLFKIRSLSGGVQYLNSDNSGSFSPPTPQIGGWPANNEWDKYISKSSLNDQIVVGSNDVWNYNRSLYTMTRSVSVNNVVDRTVRPHSSISSNVKSLALVAYSFSLNTYGFRPVLEYIDPKLHEARRPITLWY